MTERCQFSLLLPLLWLLSLLGAAPLATAAGITVLHNVRIHTMNPDQPVAGTMAFDSEGRIVAVGGALMDQYPQAQRLDGGGATVVPGFIDAHAHLTNLGVARSNADLTGTASKSEIIIRLQEMAASLPESSWLLGRGWDQNDWPQTDFPSAADLDAHFPDRPVWLTRIDGHAGWANSAAMALVEQNLTGDWQPEGGQIFRTESGQPSGIFLDAARALVESARPPYDEAYLDRALDRALAETARHGLTGVHEAGVNSATLERYQRRIDAGRFPIRVYAMAGGDGDALARLCADGPIHSPRLVARSVKLYADGALGSRGAALHAPYSDDADNRGVLIRQPDELAALAAKGMGCGLQVNIHAIGDRGNTVSIDALSHAMEQHPDHSSRHRVEHVQVISSDDIRRMGELELIASVQPTHATSDMYWAEARLGSERVADSYAWQALLAADVPLALGSDFPVESVSPLLGFYAAVTRQDTKGWPDGGWRAAQRLSRQQALHGFTLGAAYAAFMEDEVGSLTAGKRADFVLLDQDLMTVEAEKLPQIQVIATYLDGRAIYTR